MRSQEAKIDILIFQSVFLLSLCLAGGSPEAEAGPAAYASDFTQYFEAEDNYEPVKENIYHIHGNNSHNCFVLNNYFHLIKNFLRDKIISGRCWT